MVLRLCQHNIGQSTEGGWTNPEDWSDYMRAALISVFI